VAIWEPETIDPAHAAEESGVTISSGLFEGLLDRAPDDGPARPGVASSYEVSGDGRTWTFHLRPEARWSDGREVKAGDFVYAWKRVLDAETGSRNSALLFFIDGARGFHTGESDASTLGIAAPDESTVIVRLHHAVPFFSSLLSYPAYFPVRKDVVERHSVHWIRPGANVSNGAFRLKAFEPGVKAVLERNPFWWNAGTVELDEVVFHFIENDRLAFDWFRAGKVHWLKGTLSRDQVPVMRRTRPSEFHTDPVLCSYYAVMRVDRPPFDDLRLRRAMNLAVDKEQLVREVLMGGQDPAEGIVPPAIEKPTGYAPLHGQGFDPVEARVLMEEYVGERGGMPRITYLYNTGESHRLTGEFLQSQWKNNLGLDVEIQTVEWKTLLERVRTGDFQIARASWCADYVDPGNFLDVFMGGGPNNYPRFSDREYDAMLEEARTRSDWDGRNRMYRKAEGILNRSVPLIPLYYYSRIYMLSDKVRGFEPNLLDVHPLEYLSID